MLTDLCVVARMGPRMSFVQVRLYKIAYAAHGRIGGVFLAGLVSIHQTRDASWKLIGVAAAASSNVSMLTEDYRSAFLYMSVFCYI